jgi:hypothetical protein
MTPDNTTPDTPGTQPGTPPVAEVVEIKATCRLCGATIVAAPNRVALNVPAKTYQVMCSGWDFEATPHVSTVPTNLALVLLLHQGRVPYVPQGDEHDMWATVMASVVYPGETAPRWPVRSDL